MKTIFGTLSVVFIIACRSTAVQAAELSNLAGQTLLESFRCESTNGTAMQGVTNSLKSLKSTLEKIASQQKECQADIAGIGKLPEIGSILQQIEDYGASEDIKRQELIITEALNDLAIVKQIPADSPERYLYPDESTLQGMVADARYQLVRLRVENVVNDGRQKRQKYLDGVRQLDTLADELASSLRKNSPCFKEPGIRRQLMGGLVGIAGFFAKTPAGIGITLAGRVLQNIFNIGDASSTNDNMDFESSNQSLLASGMSCTMETLAAQHCRLVRQEAMIEELKTKPCQGGAPCSEEMKKLLDLLNKGKSASEAVAEVTSWLGGKTNVSSDQATAMKINSDFISATSEFEVGVNETLEQARKGAASSLSEVQVQAQRTALQYYITNYAEKIFLGRAGGTELKSMFTPEEKQNGALGFIFDEKELAALKADAIQSMAGNRRLKQVYEVEGNSGGAGTKTIEDGALKALQDSARGQEYPDFAPGLKVRDRIADRVVFDRIKSRVAQYKSTILQRTTIKPKDEQLGEFMMAFLQEDLGKPSTLKHFENIQAFFSSIPDDFMKSRGKILNIADLKTEIDEVATLGRQLDDGTKEVSTTNATELLGKVNRILDPGRGIKERIANISTAVSSFQTQKLARYAPKGSELNDLIFLQNRDFLESVYSIKNGITKDQDTKNAKALSATQIDAFGKFVANYTAPAMNFLNGNDVKGRPFNVGLASNIDQSLKDYFCVQALGLTQIPEQISKQCQGAVIRSGGNSLSFAEFEKDPHQERVCAYRNFINRIDTGTSQRKRPASVAPVRAEAVRPIEPAPQPFVPTKHEIAR